MQPTAASPSYPDTIFTARFTLGGTGANVAIKDSIDIAEHVTRQASAAFADAPPAARHAAVVERLLEAGCRIVGKTNMHELAYGVTGVNGWAGTPQNPRYPKLIPGGSSSGSAAAVAAGLVDFAVGTDTGGSIRIPATCCGVFGLKPTYGRISREGVQPRDSSLDCVGPLAPTLERLEHAMSLLDPSFIGASAPTHARIGLVKVAADPEIHAAVQERLQGTEGTVIPIDLPSMDDAYAAGLSIIGAENWRAYGYLIEGAMGEDVRTRLLASRNITADELADAERRRAQFRATVDTLLERLDVLALPTLPTLPPPISAADSRAALRLTALVRPFNVSGHPALTLPLTTANGQPAGLQLIGRRGGDAELCAVARQFVTDHRR